MKKAEQLAMNEKVMEAMKELGNCIRIHCPNEEMAHWERLRSCSASVAQIGHFYVLRSYNTTIACIDFRTNTLYDFLRYVYGYTSTSAQHISKFAHDYGCANRMTYKEV